MKSKLNYDDFDNIYQNLLKSKRKAYKAINNYLDLKIAYIEKSKELGLYNPELMKKLKEVTIEV